MSSRRSSSRENPFPSPALCPCRSVFGTQPISVYLDPFAKAAGAGPASSFTADFPQCQEPTAAEDAEAAWSEPSLHTRAAAPSLLHAQGARPGGFNKGQAK